MVVDVSYSTTVAEYLIDLFGVEVILRWWILLIESVIEYDLEGIYIIKIQNTIS